MTPAAVKIANVVRQALSTNQNGEAIAALNALKRLLRNEGLDLHDLGRAIERGFALAPRASPVAPVPPATGDWARLAAWCLRHHGKLTDKQRSFLVAMTVWSSEPTPKQREYLLGLRNQVRAAA
jgi:hypothetical protein